MESNYAGLKRTLKELLEARGQRASNKTKAALIAELTEGDRARSMATETRESEFDREVKRRLAFYGENPSIELVQATMNQVHGLITAREERENQLRIAEQRALERPLTSTLVPEPKLKVPHDAFKKFVEAEDEIDGFLQDFERQCTLYQVPAEDWVWILAGKLSGRAAEAYRALPDEEIADYNRVKEVILARYAITPEANRRRFRDTKKQEKYSYTEWACRMQRAALAWVHASQVFQQRKLPSWFYWNNFSMD